MALMDMSASPKQTISIGDDAVTDIYGAQRLRMKGWLVKSGKYKNEDRICVKPDKILESRAD